jgi:ElaB/YqjD/DUF883 family membrane-anchored ribosome-binding protein
MQTKVYQEYEKLLRKLHVLNQAGKLDSDEADKIREEMNWESLSEEDRHQIEQLSESLYLQKR